MSQANGRINGRIVVIDHEKEIRDYFAEVLSLDGYACTCFQESLAALLYLSEKAEPPDLVMTDIRMPGMNGLELVKRFHDISPRTPVVLISGLDEQARGLEAVRGGAADYLRKPAKPSEVLSVVARRLHRDQNPSAQEQIRAVLAHFLANYAAHSSSPESTSEHLDAAELFRVLGFRRYPMMQHSLRVAAYAALLGQAYGLSPEQLRSLELGALLHDIGKIAIPRNVLLKPAALDDEEWEVMQTHPRIGYQLLAELPAMQEAVQVVYAHHERYDGKGYPRRLKREEIPVAARLFSIVDTVDAITCDRPYRKAQPFEKAYAELRRGRGAQFDPQAVDVFLTLPLEKLQEIRDRLPDTE
jgi:putative two-component system response regulator